jgi:hypothetical protein
MPGTGALRIGWPALALTLCVGCAGGDDPQPEPNDCGGYGAFSLEAKYQAIKSYPGGGGLFIVRVSPSADLVGEAQLTLSATRELNARLTRLVLNRQDDTVEVTIQPSRDLAPGDYRIEVEARSTHCTRRLPLDVKVVAWDVGDGGESPQKRDEFLAWLNAEHPELGGFSSSGWSSYQTYPEILIVEHWTFLNERWEMRVCFHVMIPPHDWSMVRLRSREAWDPVLAARRDSDGAIHEIAVGEYPLLQGY